MFKTNQMFLKCFCDKTVYTFSWKPKYCINIDPGCEFFYAKFVSFNDKSYQEINFNCYLSSVLLYK